MQINFNNVRRKAGRSYNRLVKFLLAKNNEGTITFLDHEIEDTMNDLRSSIGAIMCTYEEGDDDFIDVYNDPMLLIYGTFFDNDEFECHAE